MAARPTGDKAPLYRKVNTRTHGVHHGGGESRWERNTRRAKADDRPRGSMHAGRRNGRDYTPLFRFLLASVGRLWAEVHGEAAARLDSVEPILWMVALTEANRKPYFRAGESSYFSGLCVDAEGRLALVDPDLSAADLEPFCPCCTHTLNGVRFGRPYRKPEHPYRKPEQAP
jgi:hypothetical protein